MFIPDNLINNAVEAIITTRDFCGNEKQAVKDLCADEGLLAQWQTVWKIANFRANKQWNDFKKEAGVNPKYIF